MDYTCQKTPALICASQESIKNKVNIISELDKGKYEFHGLDDASTESDATLKKNKKMRHEDATSNFMVKEDDGRSYFSQNKKGHSSAFDKNMAKGCERFALELGDNIGLGKPCSCSFCLKATHMWVDLTIQDSRGRVSVLQRSKKRVSDQIAKFNHEFSRLSKSANVDFDHMQNWKMMFSQTQDALAHQITRTKSELHMRSKLMEKCKRELEAKSSKPG